MLLTIQDLAIIALIITGIILVIIWRVISSKEEEVEVESTKSSQSSRAVQFLEAQGYRYVRNISELKLNILIDDNHIQVVTGRNVALLKKGFKKYLLKIKTSSMVGKKYTSAIIRTPLLEMQNSYSVNGVILYDSEKDKFQVISIPNQILLKKIYIIFSLLTTVILILTIIIVKQLIG